MSGWNGLGIEAALLQALEEQGFSSPTPIQALSIPPAVDFHQDIIGAAETVSLLVGRVVSNHYNCVLIMLLASGFCCLMSPL